MKYYLQFNRAKRSLQIPFEAAFAENHLHPWECYMQFLRGPQYPHLLYKNSFGEYGFINVERFDQVVIKNA